MKCGVEASGTLDLLVTIVCIASSLNELMQMDKLVPFITLEGNQRHVIF
jgi:hypothetical protein